MNPIHRRAVWVMTLFSSAIAARAQLTVVPDAEPQRVFAGDRRKVAVVFHYAGEQIFEAAITAQLFQITSATAARLSDEPVKKLQILPRQTVVESARFSFPEVKAETGFLIQWLDNTQRVFGTAEVRVFPTNLLARLRTLAGEMPPGVFDPGNQLKPLLRTLAVEFQDLGEDGTDKFRGRLALCGPFNSRNQMREGLAEDIRSLAKRGVAVVWLQPATQPGSPLKPSFCTVRAGNGAVVVAQGNLVSRLADDPQAQLNLIRLAEVALHP